VPYAAPSSEKSSTIKSSVVISAKTSPAEPSRWESLSFASTLYLCPILDALLISTPNQLRDELRLGLQEALVNAAKHGNNLDPEKVVSVRYTKAGGYYWWIVTDQGEGFEEPTACACPSVDQAFVSECGRGLYILHQVFDQVQWSNNGKEVHLAKHIQTAPLVGLLSMSSFIRLIESWWRRWSQTSAHSI